VYEFQVKLPAGGHCGCGNSDPLEKAGKVLCVVKDADLVTPIAGVEVKAVGPAARHR